MITNQLYLTAGLCNDLPRVARYAYHDPPERKGLPVEFRLLYSGRLNAQSDSDCRTKQKNEIRRRIPPQLRELWQQHPFLKNILNAPPEAMVSVGGLAENFKRVNKRDNTLPRPNVKCRSLNESCTQTRSSALWVPIFATAGIKLSTHPRLTISRCRRLRRSGMAFRTTQPSRMSIPIGRRAQPDAIRELGKRFGDNAYAAEELIAELGPRSRART